MVKHSQQYRHKQVMKIARMQALVTEGLKSGVGKHRMEELRNEARNKAETLRALTLTAPHKIPI